MNVLTPAWEAAKSIGITPLALFATALVVLGFVIAREV